IPRYYANFFGIARHRDEKIVKSIIEADEIGRLIGLERKFVRPALAYKDPDIAKKLRGKVKRWGARFNRLVVKGFPTKTLTIPMLEQYLDYMEAVEGFTPDVILLDYPDLMAQDIRYLRSSIGQTYEQLRGIAIKRN